MTDPLEPVFRVGHITGVLATVVCVNRSLGPERGTRSRFCLTTCTSLNSPCAIQYLSTRVTNQAMRANEAAPKSLNIIVGKDVR